MTTDSAAVMNVAEALAEKTSTTGCSYTDTASHNGQHNTRVSEETAGRDETCTTELITAPRPSVFVETEFGKKKPKHRLKSTPGRDIKLETPQAMGKRRKSRNQNLEEDHIKRRSVKVDDANGDQDEVISFTARCENLPSHHDDTSQLDLDDSENYLLINETAEENSPSLTAVVNRGAMQMYPPAAAPDPSDSTDTIIRHLHVEPIIDDDSENKVNYLLINEHAKENSPPVESGMCSSVHAAPHRSGSDTIILHQKQNTNASYNFGKKKRTISIVDPQKSASSSAGHGSAASHKVDTEVNTEDNSELVVSKGICTFWTDHLTFSKFEREVDTEDISQLVVSKGRCTLWSEYLTLPNFAVEKQGVWLYSSLAIYKYCSL